MDILSKLRIIETYLSPNMIAAFFRPRKKQSKSNHLPLRGNILAETGIKSAVVPSGNQSTRRNSGNQSTRRNSLSASMPFMQTDCQSEQPMEIDQHEREKTPSLCRKKRRYDSPTRTELMGTNLNHSNQYEEGKHQLRHFAEMVRYNA